MKITNKNLTENDITFSEISLTNANSATLVLCSFGASVRDIIVPDKTGVMKSVILAPKDYADCLLADDYHGKTLGRTAGRVGSGEYTLDGKTSILDKNNMGVDCLHGGTYGFHARNFSAKIVESDEFCEVVFSRLSPSGECGFLGNVNATVTYRFYEKSNLFDIIYSAEADQSVLLNLSNHAYFNLSGNLEDKVFDTEVFINASRYGKTNERFVITEKTPVDEVFDFRKPKKLGEHLFDENLQAHTLGYDTQFFLDKEDFGSVCASAYNEKSGIKLNVYTTYPVVSLYTNNYPCDHTLFFDKKDEKYLAFCFECFFNPNGVHMESERNGVIKKGDKYFEKIRFEFLAEK